jgi:hypothetical protein
MAEPMRRWRLDDWIDLEAELADEVEVRADEREAVAAAVAGLDEAAARRAGVRAWWHMRRRERPGVGPGERFLQALAGVTAGIALVAMLGGGSAVLGMVDAARGGVNVVVFLGVVLGVQGLLLAVALGAVVLRRRGMIGFGLLPGLVARLARRMVGEAGVKWWDAVAGNSSGRAMLGWRLLRSTQVAALAFNLGVLGMLGGLVLARHVGFYWETTTEGAMRGVLEAVVRWLSTPWAAMLPSAVPDTAVIEGSRWLPGREAVLDPGPAEWWRFLLLATLVWGFLPRLLLWGWAWRAERREAERLDFQGRPHRALWRALRVVSLETDHDAPADGALVLDVGGAGFNAAALRPFLLRRLRVNPTAWLPVAVMDEGAEAEARRAIEKAPAGVVLLAEAWALSPPRMAALHSTIRRRCGADLPVRFLVANVAVDGQPQPPTAEEIEQWERFVDGLRDPAAEVHSFVVEEGAPPDG